MSDHIQIKNIKPKIQYISDGSTTNYSFPFSIFDKKNIEVYFGSEKQNNNYTIEFASDTDGGTVILDNAPTQNTVITIMRYINIERTTDFQAGGAIRAEELNHELDYQIACTQQLKDELNRTPSFPSYMIEENIDLTMPYPSAGKCLTWSQDGKSLENSLININSIITELDAQKTTAIEQAQIATENADLASSYLNSVENIKTSCENILTEMQTTDYTKSDFSNSHFISNCILSAPQNKAFEFTDSASLLIKQGLRVLIPNGLNPDGSYNNIVYTVPEDIPFQCEYVNTSTLYYVAIDASGTVKTLKRFAIADYAPTPSTYGEYYYNRLTNKVYYHAIRETEWQETTSFCIIGTYTMHNNQINYGFTYTPFHLLSHNDVCDLQSHAPECYENLYGATVNLNNYIKPGTYIFSSSGTIQNIPVGNNGILLVFGCYDFVKQLWFRIGSLNTDDSQTYVRTFERTNNTWSSWTSLI